MTTDPSADFGYIINVPIYLDCSKNGAVDGVNKEVEGILDQKIFSSGRKFRVVLGLNNKIGTCKPSNLNEISKKVQGFVDTKYGKKLKNVDVKVKVMGYQWTSMKGEKGPNYSDLRNILFHSDESMEFYSMLISKDKVNRVFLVNLDPDTRVGKNVFEKIEGSLSETSQDIKKEPLVIGGVYKFKLPALSDLKSSDFIDGGVVKWDKLLPLAETEIDLVSKSVISEEIFEFVKFPYEFDKTKIDKEMIKSNVDSIENSIKELESGKIHLDGKEDMLKNLSKLKMLWKDFSGKKNEIVSLEKLEKEVKSCLEIKHRVKGSQILYPPEPLLFVSLYKGGEGGHDLVAGLKKEKVKLWGDYSHTQEGETLVATVRRVWRACREKAKSTQPVSGNQLTIQKREYVRLSLNYETEPPPRILEIDENILKILPKNKADLLAILKKESGKEWKKFVSGLKEFFKGRSQSSLAAKFLAQRSRFLLGKGKKGENKPSRFGERAGKQLESAFQRHTEEYVEQQRDHAVELVVACLRKIFKDEIQG